MKNAFSVIYLQNTYSWLFVISKIVLPLHPHSEIDFRCKQINKKPVPWMSGLVSGLQNRVRRFESARNLRKLFRTEVLKSFLFP